VPLVPRVVEPVQQAAAQFTASQGEIYSPCYLGYARCHAARHLSTSRLGSYIAERVQWLGATHRHTQQTAPTSLLAEAIHKPRSSLRTSEPFRLPSTCSPFGVRLFVARPFAMLRSAPTGTTSHHSRRLRNLAKQLDS